MILPVAPIDRVAKKAGAKRLSDDAKITLTEVIEEIAFMIAERAAKLAKHTGRKTIQQSDIELAKREIWG